MFPETWVWCDKYFFFIKSRCVETCIGVLHANISPSPDMCARVPCMSKETYVCKKRPVKETCKKGPLTILRRFPVSGDGKCWGHVFCNALQRTATHCSTLQHTATHCNTTCEEHVSPCTAHFKNKKLMTKETCKRDLQNKIDM